MKEEKKMTRVKKFLHNLLGWGFPLDRVGGDSFQPVWCCRFCFYGLVQDSTGAWFHLSSEIKPRSKNQNEQHLKQPALLTLGDKRLPKLKEKK